jgi:hypothetical protein
MPLLRTREITSHTDLNEQTTCKPARALTKQTTILTTEGESQTQRKNARNTHGRRSSPLPHKRMDHTPQSRSPASPQVTRRINSNVEERTKDGKDSTSLTHTST